MDNVSTSILSRRLHCKTGNLWEICACCKIQNEHIIKGIEPSEKEYARMSAWDPRIEGGSPRMAPGSYCRQTWAKVRIIKMQ